MSLLPRIFRPRDPNQWLRTPPFVPQGAWPSTVANISTPDRVPVDDTAPAPELPPPSKLMQPPTTQPINIATPSAVDVSEPAPLYVTRGKYGRPQHKMIGDGSEEDRALAYRSAVETYQPQKAHGFWDRFLKPALIGGGLGFLAGGPGGAIGGAATNAIRSGFDPSAPNRDWQRRELASTAPGVASIYARRKQEREEQRADTAENKAKADIAYTKKRTEELGKGKPQLKVNERGEWVTIDPATRAVKPVLDPTTGQPAKAQPTGQGREWIHTADGVAHLYVNGKDSGQVDEGRRKINVEGYGLMTPGEARSADATAGREARIEAKDVRTQTQDRATAAAKKAALTKKAADLIADAQIYENNARETDVGTVAFPNENGKADRQRLLNQAETARQAARAAQAEADGIVVPDEPMTPPTKPSGGKYRVSPRFLKP